MASRTAVGSVGVGVVLAAITAIACDSFSDGGNSSSADSGTASGEGGSDDAGPTGPTFCEQDAGAFCDDFEQPGRTLSPSMPLPWEQPNPGPQPSAISLGEGNGSPKGFRVVGSFAQDTQIGFGKRFDIRKNLVRLSVDVKLVKLAKIDPNNPTNAQLGVAGFLFPNLRGISVVLIGANNGLIGGAVRNALGTDVTLVPFTGQTLPPIINGPWQRIIVEYEPDLNTDWFRVYFGPASGTSLPKVFEVRADPPGIDSALAVGATPGVGGSDFDVSLDNVHVTAAPR